MTRAFGLPGHSVVCLQAENTCVHSERTGCLQAKNMVH